MAMVSHFYQVVQQPLAKTIEKIGVQSILVTETKTVADLLKELNMSEDHVVLLNGKRVGLDYMVHENDTVVILPLIEGG